jgi:hypothetical protein
MRLVIEYLDGTKDVTEELTSFNTWDDLAPILTGSKLLQSMEMPIKGRLTWIPAHAIKKVYEK